MVESMMAPTTVPQICPEPPRSAVPPMITAAMASNSHNTPVLADAEPTRGIDVGTKRQIYFFIQKLLAEGKAVVLISSELPEIVGLAHRAVVMRSGVQMGTLTGDELSENELVRYATGLKRRDYATEQKGNPHATRA